MVRVDVGEMIEELRGLFEADLKSKSIELKLNTPLPVLHAELARIRQIFQNLIDNAIKYMGNGPCREIHVGCLMHVTEAEFYVRDTGIGIDPEDLDKVFFVFRRGKNAVSQQVAGKGVGLASVKSIVETYNGRIWVTSTPGEGSTFRFSINGKFVAEQPSYIRANGDAGTIAA
jgi:signal transduction histidine kinase